MPWNVRNHKFSKVADNGISSVLSAFYVAHRGVIYGGCNEIQRDIISKRVLNLPT
jgi:hypothetical protein